MRQLIDTRSTSSLMPYVSDTHTCIACKLSASVSVNSQWQTFCYVSVSRSASTTHRHFTSQEMKSCERFIRSNTMLDSICQNAKCRTENGGVTSYTRSSDTAEIARRAMRTMLISARTAIQGHSRSSVVVLIDAIYMTSC